MKTTKEQRDELRRLADSHSVLKWPELIDLLDDFDELEAENTILRTEVHKLHEQIERLKAPVTFGEVVTHYKELPSEQYDIAVRARCRMVQAIIAARLNDGNVVTEYGHGFMRDENE